MSALRGFVVLVAATAIATFLSACSQDPPEPPAAETTAVGDATAVPRAVDSEWDREAFCSVAAPLRVAVDREFVGSDAHVQQLSDLADVAPHDLMDVIETMTDHYEANVSPADPESQNFDNFPAHIQRAALELDSSIQELCSS